MKRLWDPPTEIQASGFRSAARRFEWIAERCSEARVRCAAANTAAPLPPARRCARESFATDGSAGNQIQSSFFVLRKTRTR
jgi:hypothetical protein